MAPRTELRGLGDGHVRTRTTDARIQKHLWVFPGIREYILH